MACDAPTRGVRQKSALRGGRALRRGLSSSYVSPNCVPRKASVMESPRKSMRQRARPATPASRASLRAQAWRVSANQAPAAVISRRSRRCGAGAGQAERSAGAGARASGCGGCEASRGAGGAPTLRGALLQAAAHRTKVVCSASQLSTRRSGSACGPAKRVSGGGGAAARAPQNRLVAPQRTA